MTETEKLGLLALVIQLLNESGSWTGRLHIQKFVYFAQEVLGLRAGYDFVLYQRGPYSFELDSDIRSARSIGSAEIVPLPPYGPKYVTTSTGQALIKHAPVDEGTKEKLTRLAEALGGSKHARDLELLATTLYAVKEGYESDTEIAGRLLALKPHFSETDAERATREVRRIQKELS